MNDSRSFLTKMFSIIDAKDFGRLQEIFAKNAIYERPGYDCLCGFDGILEFYRNKRVISSGHHVIVGLIADSDKGSCWGYFTGVKNDGVPVNERFSDVYEFHSDLIVRRTTYFYRPAV